MRRALLIGLAVIVVVGVLITVLTVVVESSGSDEPAPIGLRQ